MKTKDLMQEFDKCYITERLKPTTANGYRVNIRCHILPYIAETPIEKINLKTLEELTDTLRAKGLSNKTIVYVHATLRKALNFAIRRRTINWNPYEPYDLPKVEQYKYKTLNPLQIQILLDGVKGKEIEPYVRLAVCYGLRRGEILGISTDDYDPEHGILHIQRTRTAVNGQPVITTCKTKKSNRYILVAKEDEPYILGKSFEWSPTHLDTEFKKVLKSNDLPKEIRFHDLRHSYATWMLTQEVNPKIVSEVLGHSSVKVTLDIYSHANTSMQRVCHTAMGKS